MTAPPITGTVTAYERIVDFLRERGPVREFGGQARAKCPAHEGSNPASLTIYRKPGKAKIVCYVGCDDRDVLAALELGIGDLFDVLRNFPQQSPPIKRPVRSPLRIFPQSPVDRALQRLLALPDLAERLCRCIARQDEISAARHAATYWLRRADRFAAEGRHQAALACRNKAAFLLWDAGDGDLDD